MTKIKKGMGGSNKGRSRTEKTKILKEISKKLRRKEAKKEVKSSLDV